MNKLLLTLVLLVTTNTVMAQSLTATPITAAGPQPATAVFTVNGGIDQNCTLLGTPKVMSCSLTNITVPGTYTLIAKYVYTAGCDGVDTCWAAGEAASAPFTYNWTGVPVQKPIGVKIVIQ